jgi:hypothetical protein
MLTIIVGGINMLAKKTALYMITISTALTERGKTMEQRLIDANALIKWINGTGCFMDVFKRVTTNIINKQPTVDAVPVDFIKALHTDYVQRSKALQGRTAYMYTLYAIALENLMQSFDYDNEIADIMRVERNCADGERKDDGNI